jgi:hypothetical protein
LATSGAVATSSLTSTNTLIEFTFSGAEQISLEADTKYVLVVQNTSTNQLDTVGVRLDASGNHSGNAGAYSGGWVATSAADLCFYVYGTGTTPTVTTQACSSVTHQSASGNGTITSTGGLAITERGFCYMEGTSGDPTTADSKASSEGTYNEGVYTESILGLSSATNYRVRAFCTNSEGTAYGTTVQLTTLDANGPVVTTEITSLLKKNVARVGGDVTDSGTESVTERGIYWGTSEETQATKIAQGSGEGEFVIFMTGLDKDTTYYYKAFATSSVSTSYGDILHFTTGNEPTEGNIYAMPPFAN